MLFFREAYMDLFGILLHSFSSFLLGAGMFGLVEVSGGGGKGAREPLKRIDSVPFYVEGESMSMQWTDVLLADELARLRLAVVSRGDYLRLLAVMGNI